MVFKIQVWRSVATLVLIVLLFAIQLPLTIVGAYLVAFLYCATNRNITYTSPVAIVVYSATLLLFLLSAISFNNAASPIGYLILGSFMLLMAYTFTRQDIEEVELALAALYWIFAIAVLIALVIFWEESEPLGAILPWSSTNGVPSYLIVVQLAYSLSYYTRRDRLPLLSSFVTLVVALCGLGRGSIIVALMICIVSIVLNIFVCKSHRYKTLTLKTSSITILASLTLLFVYDDVVFPVIEAAVEGSKFSEGVLDEYRGAIIRDYLAKIDGFRLLFGASYDNTVIETLYDGNPHNSYIRAHSFYGIVGLISIFIPVLVIGFANRRLDRRIVFVMLISLALIRAISEPIFFPTPLDLFYFIYILIFFRFSDL